ncbi:NADH-quinone oxidoreductase subunit NuoH [Zavarzinella formosa]|uniref:NADH-quinone oxidoreductase subunit NuoH n=1 Tax=Zavarzinella formosa TaxID=360055 RepID=UPI0002FD80D8|nr:NADH-quinone oxidoreductase subunit NuoH [Zavarzinella formosa]
MKDLFSFLPTPFDMIAGAVVAAGLLVTFVATSALFFIWLERKVSARMQDRLGPTRVGPYGLLQTLADGLKLLTKEDVSPDVADKLLFNMAPYVAFCASFVAFISLPFGNGIVAYPLNVAAFFVLAVLSSEIFGVILAGYSSGSKWSLFGGIREAAQVVSYEVPRSLCVLVPVIVAGTLNLNTIGHQQQGFFWQWNVFHDPFTLVAFVIFFIVATASCKRAPFDLAEAESELVAGFHTEYSGLRWSVFFMAEYASMFAVSGAATLLFLGGWHTGLLPFEPSEKFGWAGHLLNLAVFIFKGFFLVFVMMWMRWSLPRLRIDQVMMTCLKYFLPISCGLLLGVCVWELYVPNLVENSWKIVAGVGTLLASILLVVKLFTGPLTTPNRELPGVWAGRPTAITPP